MKQIYLSSGPVTLVDDDVFEWAKLYTWSLGGGGPNRRSQYVARRTEGTTKYLHRLITGAGPEEAVDHRDGDRLNNQRANLRLVTPGQNQQNKRRARKDSTTGVRGVLRVRDKFYVAVTVDGACHRAGKGFASLAEAAAAAAALRELVMPYCEQPADDALAFDKAAVVLASEALAEWRNRAEVLKAQLETAEANIAFWMGKISLTAERP